MQNMEEIEFIQSMQKLELMDGDILVLKHPRTLSDRTRASIKAAIEELATEAGFDIKAFVLEDGMDIGILRKLTT
jgi:hypothetical protein